MTVSATTAASPMRTTVRADVPLRPDVTLSIKLPLSRETKYASLKDAALAARELTYGKKPAAAIVELGAGNFHIARLQHMDVLGSGPLFKSFHIGQFGERGYNFGTSNYVKAIVDSKLLVTVDGTGNGVAAPAPR